MNKKKASHKDRKQPSKRKRAMAQELESTPRHPRKATVRRSARITTADTCNLRTIPTSTPRLEGIDMESFLKPSEDEIAKCNNSRKLNALGTFYERLHELCMFKSQHGTCNVPQKYSPKKQLGVWVNKVRMEKKKHDKDQNSSLTHEKISKLNQLGFDWGENKGHEKWEQHFKALELYRCEHGDCNVPTKYAMNPALGRFVSTQRCEYRKWQNNKKSLIDDEKVSRLNRIGFVWDMTK